MSHSNPVGTDLEYGSRSRRSHRGWVGPNL